jgi:subtilisin family serine protease
MRGEKAMKTWLSILSAIAANVIFTSWVCAQGGGQINNEIHVIAADEVFQIAGSGKVSFSTEAVAAQQVYSFLDSAGAVTVWRIFPEFVRAETLSTNREGDTVRLIDLSKYYGIEFSDSVSWAALDSAWHGSDAFRVVSQAGYSIATDYYVNDPQYWRQWYLRTGYEGSQNVAEAWYYSRGSSAVKVCVIDDGIDYGHADLASRITAGFVPPLYGVDFQPTPLGGVESHGTACAGIVAAIDSNGIGIAGADWHCQLYIARAATYLLPPFSYEVVLRDDNVGPCIDWATRNNVDVITMSFGGIDDNFLERVGHNILFGNVEAAALYNAWQKGVLLIAAKGNDNSGGFNFPSDLETVMGVGACDLFGQKASFSNWGQAVDVVTNGTDGYSTAVGNTYQGFAGTSMSSPVAAGVASLLKAYKPDLTADEIEQIMELTAKDRGDPGWDDQFGWGIVKADSAMRFISNNQFYRKQAVGGARQMVQGLHQHTFRNSGGLSSGNYFVETYKYVSHFDFPEYRFSELPKILYRYRGAKGWSASNPNEEFAHMHVVPGTLTTSGCDVETYAYLIK